MSQIMRWRRIDLPGHEIAELQSTGEGWKLSGIANFVWEHEPAHLAYEVRCNGAWRTESAEVRGSAGDRTIELAVSADANRRWHLNRSERPSVEGSIDLDLGFSPATNLLPLRRLQLAVGEEAEVVAAWLPFPDLDLEPLAQRYRRLTNGTYRYEAAGGGFVRNLEVDEAGFVTRYPGLWESASAD